MGAVPDPTARRRRYVRNCLFQHFEPFFTEVRKIQKYAGDITTGPREIGHEPATNRVAFQIDCHDGNGLGRISRSYNSCRAHRKNQVNLAGNKICCHRRQQRCVAICDLQSQVALSGSLKPPERSPAKKALERDDAATFGPG